MYRDLKNQEKEFYLLKISIDEKEQSLNAYKDDEEIDGD